MKNLFFILSAFCLLIPSKATPQAAIEWQKNMGGSGTEIVYSIENTSDGGYIIAGSTTSNNGDVTGNHGSYDYWIVKVDSEGSIYWQKCLGGNDFDEANSVQQTADGGYIIAGRSKSNNGDVTGNHGGYDFWVVKLDDTGNITWQKSLGGSSDDIAYSVRQTSDGGYIVTGNTFSNDGDVTNNHGADDFWVVKLDAAGSIVWQNCYGGTGNDYAFSIRQTVDGGYIVAGGSFSQDGDVTGNHGNPDFWIVKINSSGVITWQKSLGGSAVDACHSIEQTADGGYILAGPSASVNGDVTGNHGNADYWVVKTDGSGIIVWQKSLGGMLGDSPRSVKQTIDGKYIIAGMSSSYDGDITKSPGGTNFWVVKLDASGNLIWQKCMGGTNNEGANYIVENEPGEYVVVGPSHSKNVDLTGNKGDSDAWVAKISESCNEIQGKTFQDINSNNIQDGPDKQLVNYKIYEASTGRITFSDADGKYNLALFDIGNFSVSLVHGNASYNSNPLLYNKNFSSIGQVDSLNDFAYQPGGSFNDLCVNIMPTGNFRSGMSSSYLISYSNDGTTTINSATLIFYPDLYVSYINASVTPLVVNTNSVVWSLGALTPLQQGSILVTVGVNITTPLGTILNSGARIEPIAGDINPACNIRYREVEVTGSFDPNDIQVDRDTLYTTEFPNPPLLEYLIRFQNTGNDTAFTVRILNNISEKLDHGTLEFVQSSHPVTVSYQSHSRLAEFYFENILLPDSNINEPMSHGFVVYRIRPLTSLVLNDTIQSTAAIYFDFNAPVITNTAMTFIELPTGLQDDDVSTNFGLHVFPNPSAGNFTITYQLPKGQDGKLELFNLLGEIVYSNELAGGTTSHRINYDKKITSGMYMCKVSAGGKSVFGKILISK